MRRTLAGAVAAFALLVAGAAAAQSSPVSPGVRFAEVFFDIGLQPALEAATSQSSVDIGTSVGIPEWNPLFAEAVREEVVADRSALARVIGRAFDQRFTAAELEAGVKLIGSSAGRRLIAAGASGGQPGAPTPAEQRELERLMGSAAAMSFARKFDQLDPDTIFDKRALMLEIMPGVFRRFADKAEAQAARTAP